MGSKKSYHKEVFYQSRIFCLFDRPSVYLCYEWKRLQFHGKTPPALKLLINIFLNFAPIGASQTLTSVTLVIEECYNCIAPKKCNF